jgi:hypothetical protein
VVEVPVGANVETVDVPVGLIGARAEEPNVPIGAGAPETPMAAGAATTAAPGPSARTGSAGNSANIRTINLYASFMLFRFINVSPIVITTLLFFKVD